jgi:inosine-uridine nucleoside N-ribohydrolase
MTEDWLAIRSRETTPMHDPLAVAAAFAPEVVETISVSADVSLETAGSVAYFEAGTESSLRICIAVDVKRFDELFQPRILQAVRSGGCR